MLHAFLKRMKLLCQAQSLLIQGCIHQVFHVMKNVYLDITNICWWSCAMHVSAVFHTWCSHSAVTLDFKAWRNAAVAFRQLLRSCELAVTCFSVKEPQHEYTLLPSQEGSV